MVKFGNDWDGILTDEFRSEYYLRLREFLKLEYERHTVYPSMHDIFNALKLAAYSDIKAVILGQDPYHGLGQAHGLCFSVREGISPPPSLVNIFKEIISDVGTADVAASAAAAKSMKSDLTDWARQGVLLLNTTLTVRAGEPMSHAGQGWETFTDKVISLLNEREKPVIFMLWGAHAQGKVKLITNPQHYILKAPHPSPLSAHRGFLGCKHFSQANELLENLGNSPIRWV